MSHKKYRKERNCLNCGAMVNSRFCPECGQENIEIHENFLHMAGHFIADYLHYDSKFFRSLKLLFTRPGFLTEQYLEGKRTLYIHPLRLYFFITIIMVLMANLYYNEYQKDIQESNIVLTEEDKANATAEEVKQIEQNEKQIRKNIAGGFGNLSHYLKYISFFLLPVYALAFKVLYWRRKKFYVDHLVYTLHLQSFAYVVLSILLLIPLYISKSSREWFDSLLILIVAIYMVISLRHLYGQSWGKTILKAAIAIFFMLTVSVLVAAGFIFVSFI
jgi:hypothetical protein